MNAVTREEPMVKAVPVEMGWEGRFRTLRNSQWRRVEKNGVVLIFATEFEAENAAFKALYASDLGPGIVSTGHKAAAARSKAEELFGKIWPGKGKKPVRVERVKR